MLSNLVTRSVGGLGWSVIVTAPQRDGRGRGPADVHRGAALLLHGLQQFAPVDLTGQVVVLNLFDGILEHIGDLGVDILVDFHEDTPLEIADLHRLIDHEHRGAHGGHIEKFLDVLRVVADAAVAHQAAYPHGGVGAVEAVMGQAQPAAAHGTIVPGRHISHAILVLEVPGDVPAGVHRFALHPEGLADRRLVIQHPDADGIGDHFALLREEPVAPELRHVDQVAGVGGALRDDPLGGDGDVGFPGQVEVVQVAVVVGQLVEAQIVLPGDAVQVFIADDMMGLGLAHHGHRLRVHPGAPGQAVSEGPGSPGQGAAQKSQEQEKAKNSHEY